MKKVAELYYIQTPEVLLEWARKEHLRNCNNGSMTAFSREN